MQRNSTLNKALSEVRRRHYFEKRYDRQLEKSFLGMSYVKSTNTKNLSSYDTPSTYYSNRISSTVKKRDQWSNEEFESTGQNFRDGKEALINEFIPYNSYCTPQKINKQYHSDNESGIKETRSYGNTEDQKVKEEKYLSNKEKYYDDEEFEQEEDKEPNEYEAEFDEDLEEIYENRNKNASSYDKDQDFESSEEENSKKHESQPSSERGTYGSSSDNQNYQENGFEQSPYKQKKQLVRQSKGQDHQDSLLAGQHNRTGKISQRDHYEYQNENEQEEEDDDQQQEEEISFRNLRDVAQINTNTNGYNFLNLVDNERRPMNGQGEKRKKQQNIIKGSLIVQARRRALSEDRNRQSGLYDHMKNSSCDKAQANIIYSKIRCPRYLDISSKEANTVPSHSNSIDFAVMLESVKKHGTFFYQKHNAKRQLRRSLLEWNKPVHAKKTNQLSLPKHLSDLNHQPDFNYRRCHCAAGIPDSPRNLYKNAIKCESKFYQNSFIRNAYF